MKYLLCYGTLRKFCDRNHNFERFGPQEFINNTWIYGYMLYKLPGYPAATKGVGNIFCEIHRVSEETYEWITAMEKGAGYEVNEHKVEIPGGEVVVASLYSMATEHLMQVPSKRIYSGDWNDVDGM